MSCCHSDSFRRAFDIWRDTTGTVVSAPAWSPAAYPTILARIAADRPSAESGASPISPTSSVSRSSVAGSSSRASLQTVHVRDDQVLLHSSAQSRAAWLHDVVEDTPATFQEMVVIVQTRRLQLSGSTRSTLSLVSRSISRWYGSMPARAGLRGTVTVIVCSAELMWCICM